MQRRVRHDGVAEVILVLVAVGMAGIDDDLARVMVRGDAVGRIASGIVMGIGAQQLVRDVVAGDTQFEAIAISHQSVPSAFIVGGAATDDHRLRGFFQIPAVVRILVCIAAGEFVPRDGALFAAEAIRIAAASRIVGVLFALAVVDYVVLRAAADEFNTSVLVAHRDAGIDTT